MYTLHGFSQSGNTYKVALLLQALRQPWLAAHMPITDFFAGVQRSDEWRGKVNAMGEVPVLEVDGQKLTQSAAILLHLSEKHGAYRGKESDRHEVLRWLFFDNHKFTSYFATYRFLKSFSTTEPNADVMKFLRGRVEAAYAVVEKHLTGRDYLVGDTPTIADISLCGYVYFPSEESGIDIATQYPAIAAWRERLQTLPGWKHPYDLLPGERIAPRW